MAGAVDEVTPGMISDVALAHLYRGAATEAIPDAALGAALRRLFDEGQRVWPALGLGVEAFVAYLARRTADGLPPPARGPDLYLACACATHVPGAVETFDQVHLAQVKAYVARLRQTATFVDEVRQEVRGKLYVGKDGAAPKIAEYDGRGTLASWVRVIAIRAALDLRRQGGAAPVEDGSAADVPAENDPERDYQQEHYRRAFHDALRGAVAALDGEQRRLLRRHFADGITLDALTVELGVHRATVARRLAAARAALRHDARRRLQAALGITDAELESLAAVMRSHLDLSLPSLLRTG